ncbi:outer membrane protein assembly factor BamB family protein [Alienimonas californiensis]|uniref:Outer membrane biogenesis protein BamB n=1 Tax=Alienimonas californiensis TaxID=2527989 RepID=A0A517PFG5_9PLAN|nr:PQQ-binding-like beta-propeller repeat protein [Alienimonas californiensis]QDT18112.1 outer membrane biogenesis protein BamB [Alienimonas californiensis]
MPARLLSPRFLAFGVAALFAAVVSPLTAGDWPQWRGPERDGFAAADESLGPAWGSDGPEELWSLEGMGKGFASVAVVGDRLYTTGNFDDGQRVVAVDLPAAGGQPSIAWSKSFTEGVPKHGYDGSRSTPTVVGDKLYVTGSNGSIACLSTEGEVLWSKDFAKEYGSGSQSWGYAESPLVDGDRVIFTPGSEKALMVCCDRNTGKEIWKTPYPPQLTGGKREAGYSSAVISEGGKVRHYVQMTGGGPIGLRASDGKVLWGSDAAANGTAVIPTPLIGGKGGNWAFVSSGYGAGAACFKLSPAGRNELKVETVYELEGRDFQNHHGQMILADGYVYAGTGHGGSANSPVCLKLETGEIVWGGGKDKLTGSGSGSAAVIAVGDELLFRYQSGQISRIALTTKGYEEKGVFTPRVVKDPSWAHPAVAGGVLFVREQDTLMAYRAGE